MGAEEGKISGSPGVRRGLDAYELLSKYWLITAALVPSDCGSGRSEEGGVTCAPSRSLFLRWGYPTPSLTTIVSPPVAVPTSAEFHLQFHLSLFLPEHAENH